MNYKEDLLLWQEACDMFQQADHSKSLKAMMRLTESGGARIQYNVAAIYASLGRHTDAIATFSIAIQQDPYLAVAFFQRGVCQWAVGDMQSAVDSFSESFGRLRQNHSIDYRQLGLDYQLFAFEILINRGLCQAALKRHSEALSDWRQAQQWRVLQDHSIDRFTPQAIQRVLVDDSPATLDSLLMEYSPFCVPLTLLFTPATEKLRNADRVDYLGQEKVLLPASASKDSNNTPATGSYNNELIALNGREPRHGEKSANPIRFKMDFSTLLMDRLSLGKDAMRAPSLSTNATSMDSDKPFSLVKSPVTASSSVSLPVPGDGIRHDQERGRNCQSMHISSFPPRHSSFTAPDRCRRLLPFRQKSIKLKVYEPQRNETRALLIDAKQTFADLLVQIAKKFAVDLTTQAVSLRYLDEDQTPISIADDEDLILALGVSNKLDLTIIIE